MMDILPIRIRVRESHMRTFRSARIQMGHRGFRLVEERHECAEAALGRDRKDASGGSD